MAKELGMSFGTRTSFGRWCRGQLFGENKEYQYGKLLEVEDKKKSSKICMGKFGGREIWVRDAPQEPTKVIKRGNFNYYYNEYGECYGMVRDWFESEDGNHGFSGSITLPG